MRDTTPHDAQPPFRHVHEDVIREELVTRNFAGAYKHDGSSERHLRSYYASQAERRGYKSSIGPKPTSVSKKNVYSARGHSPKQTAAEEYMDRLREEYPPSDDHIERSKKIHGCLVTILRPGYENRVGFSYGCGNRTVTTVGPASSEQQQDNSMMIASSEQQSINTMMTAYHEWVHKMETEHAQHTEHVTRAHAERNERTQADKEKCQRYDERVEKLKEMGETLNDFIPMFLRVWEDEEDDIIRLCMEGMMEEAIDPISQIFQAMKSEIQLEPTGAQAVRGAWPKQVIADFIPLLKIILDYWKGKTGEGHAFYFLKAFQDISGPVLHPQMHCNELDLLPPLPEVTQMMPLTLDNFLALHPCFHPQNYQTMPAPQLAYEVAPTMDFRHNGAGLIAEEPKAEVNFGSFADVIAANKKPATAPLTNIFNNPIPTTDPVDNTFGKWAQSQSNAQGALATLPPPIAGPNNSSGQPANIQPQSAPTEEPNDAKAALRNRLIKKIHSLEEDFGLSTQQLDICEDWQGDACKHIKTALFQIKKVLERTASKRDYIQRGTCAKFEGDLGRLRVALGNAPRSVKAMKQELDKSLKPVEALFY